MRDPVFDETLLPPPPDVVLHVEALCAFCRGVFTLKLTGRPPSYCSKRCRQAAARERAGAGYGHGSSPRRRRVDCRTECELEQGRATVRHVALDLARAAWPVAAFAR